MSDAEATAWGAVVTAWILIGVWPFAVATRDQAAGDTAGVNRFIRIASVWLAGLVILLVGWKGKWSVVPTAIGAVVFSFFVWIAIQYWTRLRFPHLNRSWRIGIAVTLIWVLLVEFWGLIWDWEDFFDASQFAALNLSVPIVLAAIVVARKWIGRG